MLAEIKHRKSQDIKGELFTQTAGFRQTIGPVFVIDPKGIGHRFDPLHAAQTEDEFFSSAAHLLVQANEGEGRIFTDRAIVMLSQMLLSSRIEAIAPLPYVRFLIRLGLPDTAAHLNTIDPELATQFLDVKFSEANLALQEQPPANFRLGINHCMIKQLEMPSASLHRA